MKKNRMKQFFVFLFTFLLFISFAPFETYAEDGNLHEQPTIENATVIEESANSDVIIDDSVNSVQTEENVSLMFNETEEERRDAMTALPSEIVETEDYSDISSKQILSKSNNLLVNTLSGDLTLPALSDRLLYAIRNDENDIFVEDLNIIFDVSNGEHILSDFQDDFFFRYAEDCFVITNFTFTHQNGKLLSIQINYSEEVSNRNVMREELSSSIDSIVSSVQDITDRKEQYLTLNERIWNAYAYNYGDYTPHSNDAYGCLVRNNGTEFCAATALQACSTRLGFDSWYVISDGNIYNTVNIDGTTYYTRVNQCHLQGNNSNCMQTTEVVPSTYVSKALRTNVYTPISMFSNNPSFDLSNENSLVFLEQVCQGVNPVTLPNTIERNYRMTSFMYFWNLACEYGELGCAVDNVTGTLYSDHALVRYDYLDTSADTETVRAQIEQYRAIREKIVARALQFDNKKDQVIFVNNYLAKMADYITSGDDSSYLIHANDAYGCLINGVCVCDGYSKAFYDIMRCLEIPCEYLYMPNHRYNRVLLDDVWYMVDVTWNDTNHNCFLLTQTHEMDETNAVSPYLYVMKPDLSMKSNSTFKLMKQVERRTTHIDTSDWNFSLDGDAKKADVAYYVDVLRNTYPIEMIDVDTMTFQTEGDVVLSVDVTYKTRTTEEKEQFNLCVEEAMAKVSPSMTEQKKVAALASYVQKMKPTRTGSTDIYDMAVLKQGSYLGQTRFFCYLLELIGARFMIVIDGHNWPNVKLVYDGNVRYTNVMMNMPESINMEQLDFTHAYYLYPVFDFSDEQAEHAYLDDWGSPHVGTSGILPVENLQVFSAGGGISVKWDASSAKAPRYFLYKEMDNSGEWIQVSTQLGTEYFDTQVTGGHSYRYSVVIKTRSDESDAVASDSILYLTSPTPRCYQQYSVTENRVLTTLSWDASDGAASYEIYRMDGTVPLLTAETTDTKVTIGLDELIPDTFVVLPNSFYTFAVISKNGADRSPLSGATVTTAIPSATSVTATTNGIAYTQEQYKQVLNADTGTYQNGIDSIGKPILVRWKPVSGIVSYDLYRVSTKNDRIRFIGTVAGVQYRDTAPLGQYYYCVVPHIRDTVIPAVLFAE